ncbi:MAG: hypothetical protein RL531_274 [Actinomycetota bacterium]
MGDDRSRIERAVEYAVHVPVGFVAFARDSVPTFVQMFAGRGRREMESHHKDVNTRINNYRAMGQLAVQYGPPVIRARLVEQLEALRVLANETFASVPLIDRGRPPVPAEMRVVEEVVQPGPPVTAPDPTPHPAEGAPDPSGLAIPDYDGLAASQIIERLEGLDPAELDAVDAYERATRARRTVLGKIAILRAS